MGLPRVLAMHMLAFGLNHKTAPQKLRGRFSLAPENLAQALNSFREQMRRCNVASEATLLSTCNRTELYCAASPASDDDLLRPALEWFAGVGGVRGTDFLDHGYVKHGEHVARHAFRVASGLDSMVLGEPQILGQMKRAVHEADGAGTLGRNLQRMFQRAFFVAKEVRSTTEIGAFSVSMAAASVRLAVQHCGDLRNVKVLLVGAGEMIGHVALHFAAHTPAGITIANRSPARAAALARRCSAKTLCLTDMPGRLSEFDVVISCTASMLPIIGLGATEAAMKARGGRSTLMIDLAVPRDIEPEVARLSGLNLYSIDDLGGIVATAGLKRREAVVHAEAIIEKQVQYFVDWLDRRTVVPLIQSVNARAAAWQAAEIKRARTRLRHGVPIEDVLDALSKGLTQKMLHGVFAQLNSADGEERERLARTFARVFLGPSSRRLT